MTFRDDFVWGAAAAAYQVEGAAEADGKGPSVWDMLCRVPGAIFNGQTGAVACDHYHRYRDDIALMQAIGLQAYRLSISWPRVLPEGTGAPNPAGLGFYDALVDALLEAGITPYVTLFHWDYPYALYCRGGWLSPHSPAWFADYTRLIVDRLSDRVRHWMTLNEPQVFIGVGHYEGRHAPGVRWNLPEVLQAGHHALLAHGQAVQVIRAAAKQPPLIGFAPVGSVAMPATDSPADIEAARAATFTGGAGAVGGNAWWVELITAKKYPAEALADVVSATAPAYPVGGNTWWADPLFFKQYPADALSALGSAAPRVKSGDFDVIAQPIDFYGANIYQGYYVRAGAGGQPERLPFPPGYPMTAFYWNVTPDSLYWGPRFLYERYKLPIIITENGLANIDWVAADGCVHDPQRIDFTRAYLRALRRAAADGVDVRGYFHWSILDNFEWAEGFRQRFGLIHVDYTTQQRMLKDSAHWYRTVIASNGAALDAA
jgi:beta-glucosidase